MTFEFIPPMLMPMAAMGVLPGDIIFALVFAATAAAAAASAFGGGEVEVRDIIAPGLINCANMQMSLV